MIPLRSKITQIVLSYLFLHSDEELYINEMARKFLLDSGNLTRKLNELEKKGVLQSRIQGKERFYSLNKKYPHFKSLKSMIVKTFGIENQLRKIAEKFPNLQKLFIYGSYAVDKMDIMSDIDILSIGNHDGLAFQKEIAHIQSQINREINLYQITEKEFTKKKSSDPLLKAILQKPKIEIK